MSEDGGTSIVWEPYGELCWVATVDGRLHDYGDGDGEESDSFCAMLARQADGRWSCSVEHAYRGSPDGDPDIAATEEEALVEASKFVREFIADWERVADEAEWRRESADDEDDDC